mmetsp:Transcript_34599/g.107458  ORF Transcript_34599/g.107458 Transcript_34599/m.107458 type:complete len:215 (-) Transcript_34599:78-722(-)
MQATCSCARARTRLPPAVQPSHKCSGGGAQVVLPEVGRILLRELLHLLLRRDRAPRRLDLLPSLLETLLVVVTADEAIQGVLDVLEVGVLPPRSSDLLRLLGSGNGLPEGVLGEGVQNEGAKHNRRQDESRQGHKDGRPPAGIPVLGLRVVRQQRQHGQGRRGRHRRIEGRRPRLGGRRRLRPRQEGPRAQPGAECHREKDQQASRRTPGRRHG